MMTVTKADVRQHCAGLKVETIDRIDSTTIHVVVGDCEQLETLRGRLTATFPDIATIAYTDTVLGVLG